MTRNYKMTVPALVLICIASVAIGAEEGKKTSAPGIANTNASTDSKELKFTIADKGKTLKMKVGDTIAIVLNGNPTTGYQWRAIKDVTDAKILAENNGGMKYVQGGQPGIVGAGGTYYFYWKAVAPGETKIKLEYKRSSEKSTPAETMEVTMVVESSDVSATGKELKLVIEDNGKSHHIKVGDTLMVELKGNPTTGFQWNAVTDVTDKKILLTNGDRKYVYGGQPGMVGAGGTYYFYWKAVAPGETKIKLEYKRSWEKNAPARTMDATIIVEPANGQNGTKADDGKVSAGKSVDGQLFTMRDNKTLNVDASVNDTFSVRMSGNPTTGYQWSVFGGMDESIVKLIKENYVMNDAPAGMVGVGGNFYFTFKVVGKGSSKIRFGYARGWEKDVPPIESYELTVNAK